MADCVWAIGGTTLLYHLGIATDAPRDLDTFTTPQDFPHVAGILGAQFGAGTRKQSAVYVSDYFLTFTAADGTEIDLMAGAAVMKAGDRVCWEFDPNRIDFDDGLRWMRLEDWQTLYALFDRPHRISQIEQYLRRKNGRI